MISLVIARELVSSVVAMVAVYFIYQFMISLVKRFYPTYDIKSLKQGYLIWMIGFVLFESVQLYQMSAVPVQTKQVAQKIEENLNDFTPIRPERSLPNQTLK